MSDYSTNMATDFLEKYKFKSWTTHSSNGLPVTDLERHERAHLIGERLCSNERWKSHGHGISREVANSELQLKIDKLEDREGLERAVRRFWALVYYIYDHGTIAKSFLSQNYSLYRVDNAH